MEIKTPSVVALTWTLKDTLGEVLDTLDEPVEFFIGGQDLLPKIEEALQGHEKGAKVDLHLEPEDAFGDFNEELLFLEPLALPEGCHPDAPRNVLYTVTEIYPEHVVLDGNHPLSGIALRLHLKVESVREPTEAEVGSGSCGTGFFKIEVADESALLPSPKGPTLH
jgi:FKBP-type peptidyl-prolyl cis-trans isomerase SlyD